MRKYRYVLAAIAGVTLAMVVLLGSCATPARPWSECLSDTTSGVPEERISTVEYGAAEAVLLMPEQSKDEPFFLAITDNKVPVVLLELNYFSDGEIFKVASIRDGSCRPIRNYENAYRPGEKTLQNWDYMQIETRDAQYGVRLGYHGSGRIEATLNMDL